MTLPDLATEDDVARVLQMVVGDLDADDLAAIDKYLETASSWARRFLRDPNLGATGSVTTSFYDIREDSEVPAFGTVTAVYAVDEPGGTARLLDTAGWTYDGLHVRLRSSLDVLFDDSGAGFDAAYSQRLARMYTRVDVITTRTATIDPIIRDAVAIAAGALWTRSPRLTKGLSGEHIGDYSYTVAALLNGDPFFEQAKSLLRSFRSRGTLVP